MRLLLLSAFFATAAAAQPVLGPLPVDGGPALSVDVLYGLIEPIPVTSATSPTPGADEVSTTASAVVLGGRVPVGGVTLVGAVPMGYFGIDVPEGDLFAGNGDQGAFGLGNPYVGAEVRPYRGLVVSGGLRLPLVQEEPYQGTGSRDEPGDEAIRLDGWQGGIYAESEHFEAWLPDLFSASVGAGMSSAVAAGVRLEGRTDGTVLVPTGDRGRQGADVVLGSGLGLAADAGPAVLRAGVYGRRTLTEGRYGYRSNIFDLDALLAAGVALDLGAVRPALGVRVPLTDTPFDRDATVTLTLDVPLR